VFVLRFSLNLVSRTCLPKGDVAVSVCPWRQGGYISPRNLRPFFHINICRHSISRILVTRLPYPLWWNFKIRPTSGMSAAVFCPKSNAQNGECRSGCLAAFVPGQFKTLVGAKIYLLLHLLVCLKSIQKHGIGKPCVFLQQGGRYKSAM
jgi:hypothetical protein